MTRRLRPEDAADVLARATPLPEVRPARSVRGRSLVGQDPSGGAVEVVVAGPALVLFLSTTCDGCRELAGVVRDGVEGFAALGVLRAPEGGLPSPEVSAFTGPQGTWLVGDNAFGVFDVRSAPFFCIVDDAGAVVVEGVAFGATHVVEHCRNVAAGTPLPDSIRLTQDPRP